MVYRSGSRTRTANAARGDNQCLPEVQGTAVDGTFSSTSPRGKYCFRDLSPAIGAKRNFLTVNVTVKLNWRGGNSIFFVRVQALETIEWVGFLWFL